MRSDKHILAVVFVMALISFMSLSFVASYSFVTKSKIGGNIAQITTTNMNFTSTINNKPGVEFPFLSANYDENLVGNITINKPTGYNTLYIILAGHSTTGTTGQATYLPYEHVRIAFHGSSIYDSEHYDTLLADNPVYTPSSATFSTALYTMRFGYLDSSNTSKTFGVSVKGESYGGTVDDPIYLYDDMVMNIALQVYQYPIAQRNIYNISGHIYDSSGNPQSAVLNLQNGSVRCIADEDGAYTLYDVPNGTWKLDVYPCYGGNCTTNNPVDTSTTIRVYSGASNYVASGAGASYASGNYLQKAAIAKYTTPYKILKANSNITTNSNYAPSVSYTTPPYFNVRGIESLETTTIPMNITINADNTLTLALAS